MSRARRKLTRLLYKVHLWLGLVVAVQLLLWTVSGLFMSAWPIETIHGDAVRHEVPIADLRSFGALLSPSQIIAVSPQPVESVTLSTLLGVPVYRLQRGKDLWLVDARSGLPRPVTAADALAIARAGTTLSGPVTVTGLDPAHPPLERRRNVPGWRVAFADNTRVYVGVQGDILAIRTGLWRWYDFFWGLHILDPVGRDNFHHPLLIASAAMSLVSVLSGIILLIVYFRRKRL
jgi:hypothetical protein